jgi:hypothetical protein
MFFIVTRHGNIGYGRKKARGGARRTITKQCRYPIYARLSLTDEVNRKRLNGQSIEKKRTDCPYRDVFNVIKPI